MASLFCACNPGVHQVLDYDLALQATKGTVAKVPVFDGTFETLAESLHDAGYETAAFVANPFVLKEFGFDQGFDHFDATFAGNSTPGTVVNVAAKTWLAQRQSKRPVFLYLHYMDVHGPYEAPPDVLDPLLDRVERLPNKHPLSPEEIQRLGYLRALPRLVSDQARHERLAAYREYWEARYDAGVQLADRAVAGLREQLTAAGVWQHAYVIVTADHGESLCEHGTWDHGRTVYHPELRVPLILRWPDDLPAGRVTESVRLIDVMPTIIDQLGLPAAWQAQGRSLGASIAGRSVAALPALAAGIKIGPDLRAVYLDQWKLIVSPGGGAAQLYSVWQDPLEEHDVAAAHPEVVANLDATLTAEDARSAELRARRTTTRAHAELSPEQYERLRALGYAE